MTVDPIKVMNICDSPMAFYYQRQTNVINDFLGGKYWRYYYDGYKRPGCQNFLDLADFSTREEILSVMKDSECYLFHGTRNYRRPLYCRDGIIKSADYPKGKKEYILIHGQPETHDIPKTVSFIKKYMDKVKFFVATPNQLNLFPNVRLLPIVGQFTAKDEEYKPRKNYLDRTNSIRIIRRSEWKATKITEHLIKKLNIEKSLPKESVNQKLIRIIKYMLKISPSSMNLPPIEIKTNLKNREIVLDNRSFWQDIFEVLTDMRNSDILLENDWQDYPGGGTNHTISMEAMSLGIVCFNAMTKENSKKLSEWLEADILPPFPNWENKKHYEKEYSQYLDEIIFDEDKRIELKKESRYFFEKWLDAPKVVPKILQEFE